MLQGFGDFFSSCWLALLVTAAAAYLLGSCNSAIIVSRLMAKTDIRTYGSGNAGATNVLRSMGKSAAALTTLGDLAKSVLAVLLGGVLMNALGHAGAYTQTLYSLIGAYLAGLFCILGHLYPLYFGFRGGKGVMTTLGMMLILDWRVALLCLGLFILVVLIWRMVSLGSVCAALLLPILTFVFRQFVDGMERTGVVFSTVMAALIALILVLKHVPNLKRIAQGTENRLSFSKKHG